MDDKQVKALQAENDKLKNDLSAANESLQKSLDAMEAADKQIDESSKKVIELEGALTVSQENFQKAKELLAEQDKEYQALIAKYDALRLEKKNPTIPPAKGAKAVTPADLEFEYGGKKYQVLSGATIPGLGKRTALEIANDVEAQSFLIEKQSGVIREVK